MTIPKKEQLALAEIDLKDEEKFMRITNSAIKALCRKLDGAAKRRVKYINRIDRLREQLRTKPISHNLLSVIKNK